MKKFIALSFVSILFVSNSYGYGLRTFGNPKQENPMSVYFAFRGGFTYSQNTPDNGLTYMPAMYDRISYCTPVGGSCAGQDLNAIYGPHYLSPTDAELVDAGYLISSRTYEYADFADWDVGEDISTYMGHLSFAFGGYIQQFKNVRVEIEATQYLDAEYKSKPYVKGYMYEDPMLTTPIAGEDENMTSSLKSTLTSSSFMFNVIYDFANGLSKKGDFVPFVGAGIGIGINKTKTTFSDPAGELSDPTAPSLYPYGTCTTELDTDGNVISNTCIYNETENTKTSLAWNVILGANYFLDVDSALEFGLKFSDLGTTTWSIENADNTRSEDLMTTDHLFNTSLFIGYRKSF